MVKYEIFLFVIETNSSISTNILLVGKLADTRCYATDL